MSRSGEFELIAKYLAPLAGPNSFDLKDDAALLKPREGFDWVITQDSIAETVHFFGDETPARIAQKALRVNVSDIIAKGGTPEHYSLALGVPERWGDEEFASFATGLTEDQTHYGLQLTGGDTYKSPDHLHVSVTMMGSVPAGKYVSRLGARAGDKILVSGTIGNSAAHHWVLKNQHHDISKSQAEFFKQCYELPEPPFGLQSIVESFATASMDVSDGLLGDLQKMAAASQVSAHVERNKIPLLSQLASLIDRAPELWNSVLGGGDDYQTLFSVAPERVGACIKAAKAENITLSEIGEITGESDSIVSLTVDGVPVSQDATSYRHF